MDGVEDNLNENGLQSVNAEEKEHENSMDAKTTDRQAVMKASSSEVLQTILSRVKKKQYQEGLSICDEALLIYRHDEKLLERKAKLLCQLHKLNDAQEFLTKWLEDNPASGIAKKELDRVNKILSALEDNEDSEDEEDGQDRKIFEKDKEYSEDKSFENEKANKSFEKEKEDKRFDNDKEGDSEKSLVDEGSEEGDARTQSHKLVPQPLIFNKTAFNKSGHKAWNLEFQSPATKSAQVTTDKDYEWKHRAPPRGLASDEYSLCKRFIETGRCEFGEKCTRAHSEAEMEEWNHRFAVKKQQMHESHDSRVTGGTYIEQLLDKLISNEHPKMMLVENLEFVKLHVNSDLKVSMSTKKCTHAWTFTVQSRLCIHCIALLTDTNRSYFQIQSISVGPRKTQKYQNLDSQCQEWINQETFTGKGQSEFVYRIKVVFKTSIYGTFRQTIVFDFGVDALLIREIQVESAPVTDPEKIRKEIILSEAHRWNERTVTLVNFEPIPLNRSDSEMSLVSKYTLPRPDKLSTTDTVMHNLGKDNYRLWMHEMLYIEEMDQLKYISRFNVTTSLQLINKFMLLPSNASAAKYAHGGELFARMQLEDDLSEDSSAGRLILHSSHVCWVAEGKKKPEKVYEALIEEKGKNFIFMRLSKACVEELGLTSDQFFTAQIQFQLNRLPMCEMHSAVDKLPTLDIVFPDLSIYPSKLEADNVVFEEKNEKKPLNEKQKDAVRLIIASRDKSCPPLLIVGPFGTGKTFTMAQAAKRVLDEEGTRILICTHSNSAADLYIKEFLHDYVGSEDNRDKTPLRIMYKFRWIQTVPEVVLGYTLLEREGNLAGTFRLPTTEDILKHRVIITTLSSARYVVDLDLPKETFSHIFIDEAAQSLESETIIPLSVAHQNTRIVFAGDHMQMSPEVYSDFTRQQGFHTSLLERLHELYPKDCIYKVMLCENYRSHSAIIDFTSELFYDNKLISSGKITPHEQFYPLTFYAAKGEEIQHENSTNFYNLSEVYEIVERVDELKKKWPEEWGNFENNGISIVAPYSDQVAAIRGELRKRKLFNINVERVLNVQGKQYRVIMLSITRTRLTCRSDPSVEEYLDYGFLSNIKLLNTAITRAQSLVVVVGDPVSVCLVGKCRKVWEYFLEVCHNNDSLHGISWVPLREQLDRAELTKSFVLNPLAPEFVPGRLYQTVPQPDHNHVFPSVAQLGAWPHVPGIVPGAPFQPIYPPMYGQQMYLPLAPGLVPAMYYPSMGRGYLSAKQMNRFIPPRTSFSRPVRDGLARTVEMPGGGRGVRSVRGMVGARPMIHPAGRLPVPYLTHGYHPVLHGQHGIAPYVYPMAEDIRALSLPPQPPHYLPHFPHPAHAIRHPPAAYGGVPVPPGHFPPTHPNLPHLSSASPVPVGKDRSDSADSSERGSPRIQLLPNVRHPPHLLNKNDNRLEEKVNSTSSIPTIRRSVSPISQRPYSPANLPRDSASRYSLANNISTEESMPSSGGTRENSNKRAISRSPVDYNSSLNENLNSRRQGPELKLRTGFSRQYSDDLPTPTVITNMMQMIDDSLDENAAEDEESPPVSSNHKPMLKLKMTIAQRLQIRQGMDCTDPSSSSTPPSSDSQPSYASILSRPHEDIPEDVGQLELQTPRTPKGFITPGADVEVDPFGILKSLNIGDGTPR